ncbi:hypothetical protein KM915_21135 [Cytobacillus oceanisediminis]|uniref:hypothetical protein n=1 Tax=Cytobacillus oceanisediminis TaxID=665099 RepID=UPI001C22F627|nr:hypothetical protein [Cytobacillus oceanisediminis]MBU8732557.1 hypothetical protein [Cytobacillus oceanisediminis]
MEVILPKIDLNIEYKNRLEKTKAFKSEVEQLQQQLAAAKSKHATAMSELTKMKIYKQKAKSSNRNTYFEWIKSESENWERSGKRYLNCFWFYETPTQKFKIQLKHRHDLKVWKYEVIVSGNQVYFESFEHIEMYQRDKREGWSMGWTNFLKDFYKEKHLFQKFKNIEEATFHVDQWKKELENRFSFEINTDKLLYKQACEKYENTIRVELNHECAKTFYQEISAYPFNLDKRNYWQVEVSGENAKDTVREIIEKHNLSISILAG